MLVANQKQFFTIEKQNILSKTINLFTKYTWKIYFFNTILRRLVAWIRSSLLVKIQWQKHVVM